MNHFRPPNPPSLGETTHQSPPELGDLGGKYVNPELINMDYRHIQFCTDKSKINLYQLQELLNIAAFWAKDRKIEDLKTAITNSNPVVSVYNNHQIIGFARATSDGIYRATIWDIVIHPDYQGEGLGRKLVETVLSHPLVHRVERVYLMTTHQQDFYEKIGFQKNQTTTMVINHQSSINLLQVQEEVNTAFV